MRVVLLSTAVVDTHADGSGEGRVFSSVCVSVSLM